jgi:hypothetical protein
VQPARRGFVYAQPFVRQDVRMHPDGEPTILAVAELVGAEIPVIAPSGLAVPAGTPAATPCRTAAEALLELLTCEPIPDSNLDTLTPFYLEPPPAVPPTLARPPWPPSPKTS